MGFLGITGWSIRPEGRTLVAAARVRWRLDPMQSAPVQEGVAACA